MSSNNNQSVMWLLTFARGVVEEELMSTGIRSQKLLMDETVDISLSVQKTKQCLENNKRGDISYQLKKNWVCVVSFRCCPLLVLDWWWYFLSIDEEAIFDWFAALSLDPWTGGEHIPPFFLLLFLLDLFAQLIFFSWKHTQDKTDRQTDRECI